jgi:uncharacterized protein with FMN-binding domain
MTRITLWALSTISVLALLLGYHTSTMGTPTAAPSAAYSGSIAGTPAGSSSDASSDTSSDAGSGTGAAASGTFTGDTAETRWGPVQVAVTVQAGTITDVQVPVYPQGNPKDDEINSYALPILIQSTLDAQGSDIDMISGATVTSDGYEQSLQSALDQAGL